MSIDSYHDTPAYADAIEKLMSPQSVVVVGASQSGTGRTAVDNLRRLSFAGRVACVNPKYDEVAGYPCVPSLAEVPFRPDAVLIAVATERVLPALEAAAEKGAKGAVVLAFGFADHGEEGRERQRRLLEIAVGGQMAVAGPNCQGLINFAQPVALNMDWVGPYTPGRVSLIAESGSVFTALVNNKRGVRWRHAVSSGNEAVTDAADFAGFFVDSPGVDVLCAYLETIRRPQAFLAVCEKARASGKVVVVCPVGRSQAAQAAAVAHSGALALPHKLLVSALWDSGAIVVTTLEELLETAVALQSARRPRGNRIAVMTASGGQIELVLDNLAGSSLEVAELSPPTTKALSDLLPPFLPARNPLDWWGTADMDNSVPAMASAIAADPQVDILVQVADFTVGPTGETSRAGGAMESSRKAAGTCDKTFVVLDGVGGAPPPDDVERGLEEGIVVVSGFAEGLRAVGHLVRTTAPLTPRRQRSEELAPVAESWLQGGEGLVGGSSALELMQAAGFDVARYLVVSSTDAAVEAAAKLGFPVVLKIADDGISHKTEVGGVILNVSSESALRASAEELLGRGHALMVQEQIGGGHELILGINSERPLGSFILAGLGGIWAELIRDVQMRPVGLREGSAIEMIRSLRAFDVLDGARNGERASVQHLVDAVERLDQLALALGENVDSIDVNPLVVLPDRAVVVDALFVRSVEV